MAGGWLRTWLGFAFGTWLGVTAGSALFGFGGGAGAEEDGAGEAEGTEDGFHGIWDGMVVSSSRGIGIFLERETL